VEGYEGTKVRESLRVGVVFRVKLEEAARFLEGKGIAAFVVQATDRRKGPEALQAVIEQSGIEAAVLVEGKDQEGDEGLVEALQGAGIASYAFEVVRVEAGALGREAVEQAKLLVWAAVERLRFQGKVGPEHLKASFLPQGKALSRRDLLFSLLRPRYEVVPAVEAGRCTAWRGCTLCFSSCPQGAITLGEGAASIEKAKCTACGACLPVCPLGAIRSPSLSPEAMDAQLRVLLFRDGISLEPRVILFSSEDSRSALQGVETPLPPQLLGVKLPCIGALSAWLLLRCFDLGADGVAVLPCGPGCRHACDLERFKRAFRFVQALLVRIGIEAGRLQTFLTLDVESPGLVAGLQGFVREVKAMGPHILRGQEVDGPRLSLIDLLKDLSRRFHLDRMAPLTGEEVTFGVVEVVGGCTLCGACPDRCPTGALVMHEGSEASKLTFDHARCVACEACVKVCPEKVLRMERILDFARLTTPSVLAEDRMVRCRRCGKVIAPQGMVRKVQHLLSESSNLRSQISEAPRLQALDLKLCPSCRMFGMLKGAWPPQAG